MAFRLEQEDGTPADPPVLRTAVPNWQPETRFRSARRGCSASFGYATTTLTSRQCWSSSWPSAALQDVLLHGHLMS
jgi:hypothetical protein